MTVLVLDTPDLAQKYDHLSDKQFEHGKLLIADLALKQGDHVLDVGAGTGCLVNHVAEIVGVSGSVTGVDPLPLRIEIAKRKSANKPNLRFEVAGAENLSLFEDNHFDAVYLNSVFHWLPDKKTALSEIGRVLKPDGRLAISAASKERPHSFQALVWQVLEQEPFRKFSHHKLDAPLYKLDINQTNNLLTEAGFKIRSSEIKTFIDYFDAPHTVIDFSESSSFGNFLSGLPENIRHQAIIMLQLLLEEHRTPNGIELTRHLIFTVAINNKH